MRLLVVTVLLTAAFAFGEEAPQGIRWKWGTSVGLGVAAALAGSAGGIASGIAVNQACVAQYGKPQPLCSSGALALGGAVQLLVTMLLLPEAFRIDGEDPGEVRARMWRWVRWPAAILALSALAYFAGSAAEQTRFNTGQGAMVGGLVGSIFSGLSIDVLAVVSAARGGR
jgi:hypothetical protein